MTTRNGVRHSKRRGSSRANKRRDGGVRTRRRAACSSGGKRPALRRRERTSPTTLGGSRCATTRASWWPSGAFARPSASFAARTQKVTGSDTRNLPAKRVLRARRRRNFRKPFAAGLLGRRSTSELRQRKNPLSERAYPKRLMGLEPTTFCMAIRSWVFDRSTKALQIERLLQDAPKCDARGLPAITVDSGNELVMALRARVSSEAGVAG